MITTARVLLGTTRGSYLPVLVTYFAYGASAVTGVSLLYFQKEALALTPAEVADVAFWTNLPWSMKMVVGSISVSYLSGLLGMTIGPRRVFGLAAGRGTQRRQNQSAVHLTEYGRLRHDSRDRSLGHLFAEGKQSISGTSTSGNDGCPDPALPPSAEAVLFHTRAGKPMMRAGGGGETASTLDQE
jgi:hypothetical protein